MDTQKINGKTLLIIPALFHFHPILSSFQFNCIENQVEVDARNINGETPLVLAARRAKVNHVKLLIENQVKSDLQFRGLNNFKPRHTLTCCWLMALL